MHRADSSGLVRFSKAREADSILTSSHLTLALLKSPSEIILSIVA